MPTTLPAPTLDNPPILIIVALSSRIYVEAAVRAGFRVIAIDAFADIDTQKLAENCFTLTLQDGQIEAQQLLDIIDALPLAEICGLCYGAGFEDNPTLLAQLQQRLPVLGNAANYVRQCKDPVQFFAACAKHEIPYPETCITQPTNTNGWLQKSVGASGGAHIKMAPFAADKPSHYYQRQQVGQSMSCLFLANGVAAQLIGVNAQWQQNIMPTPYRYVGAIGGIKLKSEAKFKLIKYINKLTHLFNLKGLNSLDFLYHNGQLQVLELNPRLSASLELYPVWQATLMRAHVQLCHANSSSASTWPLLLAPVDNCCAHYIVYALQAITISEGMEWPDWVRDIPPPHAHFASGAPLCTVIAMAKNATLTQQLLKKRVAALHLLTSKI